MTVSHNSIFPYHLSSSLSFSFFFFFVYPAFQFYNSAKMPRKKTYIEKLKREFKSYMKYLVDAYLDDYGL